MARARFLATHHRWARAIPALVEVLRDVLAEEPTHKEAIELLADVYQATGNEEGLTELLVREIDAARARNDVPAVVALSLRLGERLLAAGAQGEARDVYRRALEVAPDDVGLLRALAGLLSPKEDARERAAVLERLLDNETGDEAGRLAIELGELCEALGDDERVRRALEAGVARAGGDLAVFERLGEFYRIRHAWDRLAVADGRGGRAAPAQPATRRRCCGRRPTSIATAWRGRATPPSCCARPARFAPDDSALLTDLVASLDALGEREAAVERAVARRWPSCRPGQRPAGGHAADAGRAARAGRASSRRRSSDREAAFQAGGDSLQPALRERRCSAGARTPPSGATPRAERRAVLRLTELMARVRRRGRRAGGAGRLVLPPPRGRREPAPAGGARPGRPSAGRRWSRAPSA